MEVDDAVQAVKLRYLNAIGIESWVRRRDPAADAGVTAAVETSSAPQVAAGRQPTVVEMLADEPVAAVRNLLDAEPGAVPAAVPPSTAASRPAQPTADSEFDAAPAPEFRLLVLYLDGSVLLVDESLLEPGGLGSEQLLLLGDVLRAARLLLHGDAKGRIEQQVFFWPQVDDAALDQGGARAREALAYHVRMRLEGGSGPILHVAQSSDADPGSGSTIAREGLRDIGVPVFEIGTDLLDPQAPARVREQLWAELCNLGGAS